MTGRLFIQVYKFVSSLIFCSVINLQLVLECTLSISTLQRYQQTLLVSFVSAHHGSDWWEDPHSLVFFVGVYLYSL